MMPRPLTAAAVLAAGTLAAAGPIAPPAGPVCPTSRTLAEIEPRKPLSAANTPGDEVSVFTITQPGTYYLTGDVIAPANAAGITVLAPDVTIDLGGFMIRGETGSASGIVALGADRLVVRSGRINGTSSHGIYAESSTNCAVQDVTVDGCSGPGFLMGAGSTFDRCTARACGGSGFDLRAGCIARQCVAANNLGAGFAAAGQCEIIACTARENASGILVSGAGALVRGCSVQTNTVYGIALDAQAALITGNYCCSNGQSGSGGGIYVLAGTTHLIIDNVAIGNEIGIRVVPFGGTMVVRNRCARNRSSDFLLAGGLADGPILNGADLNTNTNPDANYTY